MKKPLLVAAAAVLLAFSARAQAPTEQALAKAKEAVALMDDGHLPEAAKLMAEAHTLAPDVYTYAYELALCHYMQKDYPGAIEHLTPLLSRKEASDKTYQLLGNSYDMTGDAKKAIASYETGLCKFPKSGPLYLELGNMQLGTKDYDKALSYYEKGIELAPEYPSNYFRAAKLYLASNAEMWGMMYGELFMNLERNSARTAEISKLLYDTYKKEITFPEANSASVSFSTNVMNVSDLGKGKKLKLPYGITYESTLALAVAGERDINLHSLNLIRNNFISSYYAMKRDDQYPNVLFDYQQQIAKAGHAEAYNHWVLMMGDEPAAAAWVKANPQQWTAFATWFKANPLKLDDKHKFYRTQY